MEQEILKLISIVYETFDEEVYSSLNENKLGTSSYVEGKDEFLFQLKLKLMEQIKNIELKG
jgi:hypothetical protein